MADVGKVDALAKGRGRNDHAQLPLAKEAFDFSAFG